MTRRTTCPAGARPAVEDATARRAPRGLAAAVVTADGAVELVTSGLADVRTGRPVTVQRLLLPPGIVGPRIGGLVSFRSFYVNGPPYGGLVGDIQDAARYTGGAHGGPDPLAAVMARAAAPALAVSGPGRR